MAKTRRINVRVEKGVKEKIKRWAAREERTEADFSRRVFEWAFEQYCRAGDLAALRKMSVTGETQKSRRRGKEAA